jgi:hypothetical protein
MGNNDNESTPWYTYVKWAIITVVILIIIVTSHALLSDLYNIFKGILGPANALATALADQMSNCITNGLFSSPICVVGLFGGISYLLYTLAGGYSSIKEWWTNGDSRTPLEKSIMDSNPELSPAEVGPKLVEKSGIRSLDDLKKSLRESNIDPEKMTAEQLDAAWKLKIQKSSLEIISENLGKQTLTPDSLKDIKIQWEESVKISREAAEKYAEESELSDEDFEKLNKEIEEVEPPMRIIEPI